MQSGIRTYCMLLFAVIYLVYYCSVSVFHKLQIYVNKDCIMSLYSCKVNALYLSHRTFTEVTGIVWHFEKLKPRDSHLIAPAAQTYFLLATFGAAVFSPLFGLLTVVSPRAEWALWSVFTLLCQERTATWISNTLASWCWTSNSGLRCQWEQMSS